MNIHLTSTSNTTHHILHVYLVQSPFHAFFVDFCWGSTAPGRHPLNLVVKFHVECNQTLVWGRLSALDMSISVKHEFLAEVALDDNHS